MSKSILVSASQRTQTILLMKYWLSSHTQTQSKKKLFGSATYSWDYLKISSNTRWQIFLKNKPIFIWNTSPTCQYRQVFQLCLGILPWPSGHYSCLGSAYLCLESKGKDILHHLVELFYARPGKDLRCGRRSPPSHLTAGDTEQLSVQLTHPGSQSWQMALRRK